MAETVLIGYIPQEINLSITMIQFFKHFVMNILVWKVRLEGF